MTAEEGMEVDRTAAGLAVHNPFDLMDILFEIAGPVDPLTTDGDTRGQHEDTIIFLKCGKAVRTPESA